MLSWLGQERLYLSYPFLLDSKLNWKAHIAKKQKQMDLRFKELWCLLGRKSHLSVSNKLLLYKSAISPTWTYGLELWGCASKSNIAIIQRCHSKYCERLLTPHSMSTMPHSTQTWVFQLLKKSSTAEVPSTEHDYNPTRTRYFNPFQGILSHAD
jgi:hypothetical protein